MFLLLCLSLLVSKKNVSPMEIPRDFPGALSRQKNGSKMSICALSPPWKFLKVDRYGKGILQTKYKSADLVVSEGISFKAKS